QKLRIFRASRVAGAEERGRFRAGSGAGESALGERLTVSPRSRSCRIVLTMRLPRLSGALGKGPVRVGPLPGLAFFYPAVAGSSTPLQNVAALSAAIILSPAVMVRR